MVRYRGQRWDNLRFAHRAQTSLGSLLSLPARRNRHTNTLHAPAHGPDIYRGRRAVVSRRFRHDVTNFTSLAFFGEELNCHDHVTSTEHCGDATWAAAVGEDEFCRLAHERTCYRQSTT